LKCPEEMIQYMHDYLDEEILPEHEEILREHLQSCQECQTIFHELKKSIALVRSTSHIHAPANFTLNVMAKLPKEKRKVGVQRWMRHHPVLTAASLFILFMGGSVFSTWNQEQEFSVSKQRNLIVQNNTVIVPEGEVVKGDVVVRNGNVKVEGEVQGDLTVINGEKYLASAGHVTGDIEEVNEVFDWIWYQIKKTTHKVMGVFDQDPGKQDKSLE
jgi:anti-sigma factor RsiW